MIISHLVGDHEKHAKAAERLFDACDRGELALVVLPAVPAECVFVLESFYRHSRHDISGAMGTLIGSPGIEIDARAVHLDALARYRATKGHFVDCVIAATAAAQGLPVATFDRGFQKFPDVRVEIA